MKKQIILHIDTTGLKFNTKDAKSKNKGDRILHIDAIELMNGKPTGKLFETLINPTHSISREATKIHHYKQKDVKGEPTFAEISEQFLDFIADAEVIVINPWVKSFINSELHRFDKEDSIDNYCNKVTYLSKLHRELHPEASKHGLDGLCSAYQIKHLSGTTKVDKMLQAYLKISAETAASKANSKPSTTASKVTFAAKPMTVANTSLLDTKPTAGHKKMVDAKATAANTGMFAAKNVSIKLTAAAPARKPEPEVPHQDKVGLFSLGM